MDTLASSSPDDSKMAGAWVVVKFRRLGVFFTGFFFGFFGRLEG